MGTKGLRELPLISGTLVIINVIVFILCTFTGDLLYNIGRLDVIGVLGAKEYGRVIWSLFLHSDMNHIMNNMVILFFLGSMIEKEIGHIRYLVIYFLSGIGGNVLSLIRKLLSNDLAGTIGASGAVFGLDGVLLALIFFSGRKQPNITPIRVLFMIAYSLYSGYTGDNVDNAAHIGGLLTGFLLGMMMCIFDRIKKTVWKGIQNSRI